ncbi:ribonuclease P protein component [Marinimicrobium sp. ABcell2]|uniref:ribonuclease P protein component n=1 Tax=Marinimicrobium sp. ABcell2 TaxID=3069751 RepID=UPI0027B20A9B|nr:ribonuclease P protein component [Marinimicrobium sp. ABcell2]MDQ2077038.1 ribonuclease P protein component [Marinimicrobium sp. ABcell2]
MASLAFGKSLRLLTSSDFKVVFDNAPFRASHNHFLILARFNQLDRPRLGLIIGKKHVRLAHERNRLKRHIRETFRLRQQSLCGLDVIVIARKGMDELSNPQLNHQLNQQWQRIERRADKERPGIPAQGE